MKLFIGAPAHHTHEVGFVQSLMQVVSALPKRGIRVQVSMPSGDSLVHRVRNHCAKDFMASDATHMLWLDTDIVFGVEDVELLIASGRELVGGLYPKKVIDWGQVHQAATSGVAASELWEHAADYVIVAEPGAHQASAGCFPVRYLGTGFMLVAREVYEAVEKQEPDNWYVSGMRSDQGERTHCFFDTPIVDHNLLSEDYSFCRKAKQAGFQPYAHLGVQLGHVGSHCFRGDLRRQFTESSEVAA